MKIRAKFILSNIEALTKFETEKPTEHRLL